MTITQQGIGLHPKHYQELHEGSGISDEVIQARGAYTETDPEKLKALNFAEYQALAPALVLPLHTLNGRAQTYAIKPDHPRQERKPDGRIKQIKYEYPAGAYNRLDVPPTCCSLVLDVSKPLIFTEGWKKSDAAASKGLAVAALGGVWNWRTRGEDGESRPISCLDYVPLQNRRVAICYDSDVAHNENVRLARERFAEELHRRGAIVFYITLPAGPNGEKVGLDDFLLTHEAWEVWALAERAFIPEVTALQAENRELRRLQSATARANTNPHARKLAATAQRLAFELQRVKASEKPTEQGDYRISHSRLRDVRYLPDGRPDPEHKALLSENKLRADLQQLEEVIPGLRISKRPGLVTVRYKDEERAIGSKLTFVDWAGTPADLLEALAEYKSPEPERRGGKRCPGCGSHEIQQRWECRDCGEIFNRPAEPEPEPEPDAEEPPLAAIYQHAEATPAKFADEEKQPLSTPSPLPLVATPAGDGLYRTVFLPEAPASVANFESVRCRVGLFGNICAHPDRCARAGRCSP